MYLSFVFFNFVLPHGVIKNDCVVINTSYLPPVKLRRYMSSLLTALELNKAIYCRLGLAGIQ